MSFNILMIVNPKAGKAKISRFTPEIIRNLQRQNYIVTTRYTSKEKSAKDIIKDYYDPYDVLIICGGDGTLNEAIQGLYERRKEVFIGFIPVGTTNDFARSLNLSFDKLHLSKYINKYECKAVDMAKFNSHIYNYAAAFGIFSQTSYNTPVEVKNRLGRFAYIISGIKEVFTYKTYKAKITTADEIIEDEFIYGSVTNSRNVGGFKIFRKTDIEMDDGLFETILVKKPSNPLNALKLIFKVFLGHLNDKNIIFFRTSSIHFEFEKGIIWALDGEKTDRLREVSIITFKEFNKFIVPPEDKIEEDDVKEIDEELDTYNITYDD